MKRKRKILIFLFSSLTFLSFAFSVFALEVTYPRLPGMAETPKECLELEGEKRLGCVIKYIYHLILTISGIVCFFSIVSGGILYLISGGSVEKIKDAKERIFVGILGTLLLLSSYLILYVLNPQLLVLKTKIEEVAFPPAPPVEEIEEKAPVYAEIPLGRLIERVKIASEVAKYWSYQVWYEGAEDTISGHTSLKELTECLKKLTNECKCEEVTTIECPSKPIDGCPLGKCPDPCDKPRQTVCPDIDLPENLKEAIKDVSEKIKEKNEEVLEKKAKAETAKEALKFANYRLKMAEALLRDSVSSPINYDSFIGIEDKRIRKLWTYEDVPIGVSKDPSGLPVPPQECSADKPYEIVPSCTICGNILFCYGNAYRLCETDPNIPDPYYANKWLSPDTFSSGTVLYNGVTFPVPAGGVYVCDANVYGCNDPRCKGQTLSEPKDDPATFYIIEEGNEDILALVEALLNKLPPVGLPPTPDWTPGEYPGDLPENMETVQGYAEYASEKTGVRASLILALLYFESKYQQFPGSGHYPYDLCGHPNCEKIGEINCSNFEIIWDEVGYKYPQYTIYTVPVSAAGTYCADSECLPHCGGAMGPAQAMSFTWVNYKTRIEAITGEKPASPWEFQDAFLFAGLFLADKGADSQKCYDEAYAVWKYVGGHRDHAYRVVELANKIADEIGENHCYTEESPPPPPPPGEWTLPIRPPTVLSSNAQDHLNRGTGKAWDFTAECGRNIYPIRSGKVIFTRYGSQCGYYVRVNHGNGYVADYCHMLPGSIAVGAGQKVTTDTVLGKVGCTGWTSFGPHLHLQIFHEGSRVDPQDIFGSPASLNLPYKPYCKNHACPGCGNPAGVCW